MTFFEQFLAFLNSIVSFVDLFSGILALLSLFGLNL